MTRIQLRLGLALAGLLALVVFSAGALVEHRLEVAERAEVLRSLESRARLVRASLGADTDPSEPGPALHAAVDRAARAAAARVTLIAADGRVVADSHVEPGALARLENHARRPEIVAAFSGRVGTHTRSSATTGHRYVYVGLPPGPSGVVVRLAEDLAELEAVAAARVRTLVQAGVAAVLLSLVLGILVGRRMLRPIDELRTVLAGISEGDLDRRLAWSSRDTLGEIGEVINRLADELRQRLVDLTGEKEQLGAVLHGMVEGVLVVDPDGRVVLANARLRDLFGAWGEVAGRPALEVIRRADVERAMLDAAHSTEPVVLEIAAGEDGTRQVEMHAVRFPASGEQLGTVAVFHDVTEIRRLERVRSEFVANVSHELKTPLTAILGFAETLRGEGLDAEQRDQYLEVILRHAGRLKALIEDLLELSRIEGQKAPAVGTEVDPEAVATSLLRDLAPRLAARQTEAAVCCPDPVRALVDRRALEQILLNLLDNAIKYSDEGAQIALRITRDGDRIRIDVSDDGVGIPEQDQARIFERFYRVDKSRSRDLGGTGLGLSIVKHLAQTSGGEVFVESQEGKGTTFSVLLPAA